MQNPTDQAEATVPEEGVSNDGANMNRTVAVRRKAAKRTNPFDLTGEELHLMSPSPPPQDAEDIPAKKKPRLEKSFSVSTDEAVRKAASSDVSVGLANPAAENDDANPDPVTDTQPNAGETTRATRRWTSEEDAKLTSAVVNTPMKKWGKEYKMSWSAIATLVPGRTGSQCRNKWYHVLDANIDPTTARAGKWAEDEDKQLTDSVQTHGDKDWAAIAALVPSRTKNQCYRRWRDALNTSIGLTNGRMGKWAEDELTKLKDAVLTHGEKNWKEIAALVPGRTEQQSGQKWRDMKRKSSTVREKARGTLKKAPAACGQDPHSP